MRRLLPLCFPLCLLLAACGDDAPDPVVVSDTDIAVMDAAQDIAATEEEVTDALVHEPTGDVAAVGETSSVAEVEAAAPPPAASEPAAAPARDVLVDGTTGGDGSGVDEDGTETYDMAAPPLANVFSEALYNVRNGGGSLLVTRNADGDAARGTYVWSRDDQPDETGDWSLDGPTLRLGGTVYTIEARTERGLVFSGPDGDLSLSNTAG